MIKHMGSNPVPKSRSSGPSQLIGRKHELDKVRSYLLETKTRLVTLAGPGGIGKTRLAQQIAEDLQDAFADGVYFISLSPISSPELVIPAIAQVLGIKDVAGSAVPELLVSFLQDKQLLLVLDNFEQVTPAASKLSELLTQCSHLKILVTSRAVLHVRGEQEFYVPPLELPNPEQPPEREKLSQYAAVQFFLQCAQSRRDGFALTDANASAIAEICVYLEGIPLSIELAAAYIKALSPQMLLERLKPHRLEMLTHGAQDAPPRQQSLRDTLTWSYSLLEASEKELFKLASVFVGGCTLDALEKISIMIGNRAEHVLSGVTSLIDKSLLQQDGREGEPRFMMLETIREYGLERLTENEEEKRTRQAHALYYLELVEMAAPKLRSGEQEQWFQQLEQDYENLRAAVDWLLSEREDEKAHRLLIAFSWYWAARGYLSEGLQWLEKAIAQDEEGMETARAGMLSAIGMLALMQGNVTKADQSFTESFTLSQKASDIQALALSLQGLSTVAWLKNDSVKAQMLVEQALEFWKQIDEREGIAWSLSLLGLIIAYQHEYTKAFALAKEGLELFRACGDAVGIAYGLLRMAEVMFLQDSVAEAQLEIGKRHARDEGMSEIDRDTESLTPRGRTSSKKERSAEILALLEESQEISKRLGNRWAISQAFSLSGKMVAARGDQREAYYFYKNALEATIQTLDKGGIASYVDLTSCLEALASMQLSQGHPDIATQFWGAAETVRKTIGVPLPPDSEKLYNDSVATARELLGEKAFIDKWIQGRMMKPERVLDLLAAQKAQPKPTAYPDGLTSREVDVLGLIANGLTDAQVAEELTISPRTVNTHLTSVYNKIGVSTRSAATRYAIQHNLIKSHNTE